MEKEKSFIVSTKCGHVGKNKYIVIDFVIKAKNAKEAATVARNLPRVKHHWKDAIENVKEATQLEVEIQSNMNQHNPYLKCKSIQEQKAFCEDLNEFVHDRFEDDEESIWEARKQRVSHKLKRLQLQEKSLLIA